MSQLVNKSNEYRLIKKNEKVVFDNRLARAYWPFTLEEQKALCIIFYAIQNLSWDKDICIFNEETSTAKISVKEFFKILGVQGNNRARVWGEIIGGMKLKTIILGTTETGKFVTDIVRDAHWETKNPFFEVKLNPEFIPYIRKLKNNYSKSSLESILKMNSRFSVILFRNICSIENTKSKKTTFTLKKLKKILGISDTDYFENGKFKISKFEQKTICVAKREINNLTDIDIDFSKIKEEGVVKYEFTYEEKTKNDRPKLIELKDTKNIEEQKTPTLDELFDGWIS